MFHTPWLPFAVMFAVGIATARFLLSAPNDYFLFCAYGISATFFILAFRRRSPPLPPTLFRQPTFFSRLPASWFYAALIMLAFALGAQRYQHWQNAIARGEKFIAAHAAQTAPAELLILAPPEKMLGENFADYWSTAARLLKFGAANNAADLAAKNYQIKLYGNGNLKNLHRGAKLVAPKLLIYADTPPPFAGAFSYHEQQRAENLSGAARVVGAYTVTPPPTLTWRNYLDAARENGVRKLTRALPDQRGAFLAAIIFGWLDGLTPETKNAFRYSGLGHILAISGLHVGLIALIAWGCLRFFLGGRRLPALLTLLIVILFIALSGGRASALRAGGVAALYLGGIILARPTNFLNSLGLAAIFILGFNPEILFTIGFQFSFLAVIFIYALHYEFAGENAHDEKICAEKNTTDPLAQFFAPTFKSRIFAMLITIKRTLGVWFGICLAAWLGTWILMADYFNLLSLIGLIVNIFATPLLTLCLLGGAGILLLPSSLNNAAAILALPTNWLANLAAWSANLDNFGWAWFTVLPPPRWLIIIYYATFALFFGRRLLPFKFGLTRGLYVLLAGIFALTMFSLFTPLTPPRAGIYCLPTKNAENFFIVTPQRELFAIILSAANANDWQTLTRFILSLGFRQVDLITPDVNPPEAEFAQRIKINSMTKLTATSILTAATCRYHAANKNATDICLQVGARQLISVYNLKDRRLAELRQRENLATAATIIFARKTSLRLFTGENHHEIYYTTDCPNATPAQHPRENYGVIFLPWFE